MMRIRCLALLSVSAPLVACGAESYCDRVDCDDASTSTATSASSGASVASTSSSVTGAGGAGDGGAGPGGAGPGGGGGAGPFEVTPGDPKVGVLRSLDFDATVDVTWSVVEDAGGVIDAQGVYVSPESPGTFHVVATATDSGDEVEVEVSVVGLALEVAGGLPGGPGNLDGIPSRARFASPRGLGVTSEGDFVIADTGNQIVRLHREEDGEVTTLAGARGVPGSANGVGAAARFDGPTAVVVEDDVAYVVDGEGTCVRRVEIESGGVTTLAGACGTAGNVDAATGAQARFDGIQSIVGAPGSDELWVCQAGAGGARLRRVDPATGETGSVGAPALSGTLCGLAEDVEEGVVYAYSSGRDDVMVLDETDTYRFLALPGTDANLAGLAFSRSQDDLFVLDRERPSAGAPHETLLHAYAAGAGDPSEIAGGANDYVDGPLDEARFVTPGFLVAESNGHLLTSDVEGHTIRRIRFGGAPEVETVLGSPATIQARDGSATTARLLAPFHVALGDGGDVFVAGMLPDNVIRRIDGATGALERFTGVPLDYVVGSEIDVDEPVDGQADEAKFSVILDLVRVGDAFYVADATSALRRVDFATGAVETIAGALGQPGFEDGVGVAARFDFQSEAFAGGLATDGVDLYVSDPGNFAIRKVELATGEVTTIAGGSEGTADGTGDEAQFVTPSGLAYDDGVLYVADAGAHTIRAIDVASGAVTTLTGRAGLPGDANGDADAARFKAPFRVVADGIGNLYVTSAGLPDDGLPHTIRRIRLADVETSTFAGDDVLYGFADGPLPATLGCPLGMVVDGAGDLVFADGCSSAVGAIRPL